MDDSLWLLLLMVAIGTVGMALLERSRRDPTRWNELLRSLHPDVTIEKNSAGTGARARFTLQGRLFELRTESPDVIVSTALPESPLPWTQAARALGDGEVLAALMAPGMRVDGRHLSLRLPTRTLRARHMKAAISRLMALAGRLEAFPMAQALARHVLDFAAPAEREEAFSLLCRLFPDAEATRQCALACLDEEEHPGLVEKARHVLGR